MRHPLEYDITTEVLRREIKRLEATFQVDMRFLDTAQLKRVEEQLTYRMLVSLRAHVASKKLAYRRVDYPATWWDAFKLRFFPASWIKRWPIKWENIEMEAWAFHPDVVVPDKATFVDIIVRSNDETSPYYHP